MVVGPVNAPEGVVIALVMEVPLDIVVGVPEVPLFELEVPVGADVSDPDGRVLDGAPSCEPLLVIVDSWEGDFEGDSCVLVLPPVDVAVGLEVPDCLLSSAVGVGNDEVVSLVVV